MSQPKNNLRNALHITSSYLSNPSLQKGVEIQLNLDMYLVDLVEKTLEFVETLLTIN